MRRACHLNEGLITCNSAWAQAVEGVEGYRPASWVKKSKRCPCHASFAVNVTRAADFVWHASTAMACFRRMPICLLFTRLQCCADCLYRGKADHVCIHIYDMYICICTYTRIHRIQQAQSICGHKSMAAAKCSCKVHCIGCMMMRSSLVVAAR